MKISDLSNAQVLSLVAADGVAHFFWMANPTPHLSEFYGEIRYRKYLPNGTLTEPKTFATNVGLVLETMSAQISDDSQHILLAYARNDVYFIESFNGGNEWTEPIRVSNSTGSLTKSKPSMVLEKDTGRMYIGYNEIWRRLLAVREPGAKKFEPQTVIFKRDIAYEVKALGQSIDKKTSKRYFHLVFNEYDEKTYYMKSSDGGKNWTKPVELAPNDYIHYPLSLAVDMEGRIYVQFISKFDLTIMWSKDHGETWETPIHPGTGHG